MTTKITPVKGSALTPTPNDLFAESIYGTPGKGYPALEAHGIVSGLAETQRQWDRTAESLEGKTPREVGRLKTLGLVAVTAALVTVSGAYFTGHGDAVEGAPKAVVSTIADRVLDTNADHPTPTPAQQDRMNDALNQSGQGQ